VESSPSRVVDNIGTVGERRAYWKEKDEEEVKKRESVSSIEDYTQGIENTGFLGAETIDFKTVTVATVAAAVTERSPSPYEIERSREAIFLDTDEPEGMEKEVSLEDLVQFAGSDIVSREKSERERSEKMKQDATAAAKGLVTEIEQKVRERFMEGDVPSSMDITDEELTSTGDMSSPEPGAVRTTKV